MDILIETASEMARKYYLRHENKCSYNELTILIKRWDSQHNKMNHPLENNQLLQYK